MSGSLCFLPPIFRDRGPRARRFDFGGVSESRSNLRSFAEVPHGDFVHKSLLSYGSDMSSAGRSSLCRASLVGTAESLATGEDGAVPDCRRACIVLLTLDTSPRSLAQYLDDGP